jgi:predicted Zn finger-like uncharacterized protein
VVIETWSKCPQCETRMRVLENSQRTVRGGVWYEVICPNCLLRKDAFKPRRTGPEG